MRQFSVQLAQNFGVTGSHTGTGTTDLDGTVPLDVSNYVTKIGSWNLEVDSQLTKLSPGDISFTLKDDDSSTIWKWITIDPGKLPLWVTIDLEGVRVWTGTVQPDQINRNKKSFEINFTSKNWSLMLASKYLGAENPLNDQYPISDTHIDGNPWIRTVPGTSITDVGVSGVSAFIFNLGGDWVYPPLSIFFGPGGGPGGPNPDFKVGDFVSFGLPGGGQSDYFQITASEAITVPFNVAAWRFYAPGIRNAYATAYGLMNKGVWDHYHGTDGDITIARKVRTYERNSFYSVTKAVSKDAKNIYAIQLNTLEGIVSGDKLEQINNGKSASWTVLQLDALTNEVICSEEVSDIAVGDHLWFDADSQKQMVFTDIRYIMTQAALPYSLNMDRFYDVPLNVPVLSWIAPTTRYGFALANLQPCCDIDSILSGGAPLHRIWRSNTEVLAIGDIDAWSIGNISGPGPTAAWSDQITAAPFSLMPYETSDLFPTAPGRRKVTNLKYKQVKRETDPSDGGSDPWDPSDRYPTGVVVYDYTQMRRIIITGTAVKINAWSGSSWGPNVASTWPTPITSASIFPEVANGIIGMSYSGGTTYLTLKVLPSGTTVTTSLINLDMGDAVLRTSPWGCFLVGSRGYGRVHYTGGTLSVNWVTLSDVSSFMPTSFQAIDNNICVSFARFDTVDSQGKTITETWLLRLTTDPTDVATAVLNKQKVLDGAPVTLGCIRSVTHSNRLMGHCGGRMFTIGYIIPKGFLVERFVPTGMSGSELIEHCCQLLQTIAVPDTVGNLHIVSRNNPESPTNINVDQVDIQETRTWEHHYEFVRVSGSTEDIYVDVPSIEEGAATTSGKILDIQGQPLLSSYGACEAIARAYYDFFSTPRRFESQKWFCTNPDQASPWEGLEPLAKITINGGTEVWLVISIQDDRVKGTANVNLVKVI